MGFLKSWKIGMQPQDKLMKKENEHGTKPFIRSGVVTAADEKNRFHPFYFGHVE
jgi:hypothetical protein